jgi:hypothetical protein
MIARRRPIFVADLRELGGLVSIVHGRDPIERSEHFRINFASRGKDLIFLSRKISDESAAIVAAEVLSELLGAEVKR